MAPGSDAGQWVFWFRMLLDVLLKSAVVVVFFGGVALALRRSSAALRSRVWALAVLVLAVLPLVAASVRTWQFQLIPDFIGAEVPASEGVFAPGTELAPPLASSAGTASGASARAVGGGSGSGLPFPFRFPAGEGWRAYAAWGWFWGACLLVLWLSACRAAGWLLLRSARPVTEDSWCRVVTGVCDRLKVRRPVRLLQSGRVGVAMTCGTFRPVIVLPAESSTWSAERRNVVLTHEMAHVSRLDSLFENLAKAVTVIFWFQPLVWFALHRLRVERERACDDVVLNTGTRPSDYVTQLLEVATTLATSRRRLLEPLALTEGSSLKERLLRILNPRVKRAPEGRSPVLILACLTCLVTVPFCSFQFWASAGRTEACAAGRCPGDLSRALDALGSPGARTQAEAASFLYRADRARMPEIVNLALRHPDPAARRKAVEVLCKRDWYRTQTLLKKACGPGSPRGVVEAAKEELENFKKKKSLDIQLNALGYKMLSGGKTDAAIEVFRMNANAFPESSNTYDSLAEAYLAQGDFPRARENYRKSLALNPDNLNAVKMLQKIDAYGQIGKCTHATGTEGDSPARPAPGKVAP